MAGGAVGADFRVRAYAAARDVAAILGVQWAGAEHLLAAGRRHGADDEERADRGEFSQAQALQTFHRSP